MLVIFPFIGYLPKTAHVAKKAIITSKEGIIFPSETTIKSTFQKGKVTVLDKLRKAVIFAMYTYFLLNQ